MEANLKKWNRNKSSQLLLLFHVKYNNQNASYPWPASHADDFALLVTHIPMIIFDELIDSERRLRASLGLPFYFPNDALKHPNLICFVIVCGIQSRCCLLLSQSQ